MPVILWMNCLGDMMAHGVASVLCSPEGTAPSITQKSGFAESWLCSLGCSGKRQTHHAPFTCLSPRVVSFCTCHSLSYLTQPCTAACESRWGLSAMKHMQQLDDQGGVRDQTSRSCVVH